MNLQSTLQTAVSIAREAGALLRDGQETALNINSKSTDIDLVTQYDLASEALITQKLQTHFPHHQILAEEGGQYADKSDYIWYVDPLDGTNNFAHHLPVFAVSMALFQGHKPLVGVVYDPMRDECFQATAGGGAIVHRNGRDYPLKVSPNSELVRCILGTGFPYDRHTNPHNNLAHLAAFMRRIQGVRRGGAAALDLAYVAAGRLDGFWEFRLSPWDVAAGMLLIQEAGGQVTNMDGDLLHMSQPLSLIASNGLIHPAMYHIIQEENALL